MSTNFKESEFSNNELNNPNGGDEVWDLDNYDPHQTDLNVSGSVLPGYYHARIVDYKLDSKPRGWCRVFTWEIIGTENDLKKQSMIGRRQTDYLYEYSSCKEMFRRKILAMAIAINYWSRETLNSAKSQGLPMPAPVFEQFEGRSCMIKVEEEEYEGKKHSRIRGFSSVDSKEARESGVMFNDDDVF